MDSNKSLVLAAALVGAGLFAAFRGGQSPTVKPVADEARPVDESFDPSIVNGENELPPNHPPIEGTGAAEAPQAAAPQAAAEDSAPSLTWKAPEKWTAVPNPNAMRLATYRVPAAAGAPDEAELTVVRAGGSTEANLERWVQQFENPEGIERGTKTVRGLKVSTIEVTGTFRVGGMSPTDSTKPRAGWMLKGAVVETEQGPFFFKLTGPAPSVRAARRDFTAFVDSVAPASSAATE